MTSISYMRQWRKNNPGYFAKKSQEYKLRQLEINPAEYRNRNRLKRKKYVDNLDNRKKLNARRAVKYAIEIGKLVKPTKCEECMSASKLSAHHNDYNRKLEVLWVCSKCHGLIHSM